MSEPRPKSGESVLLALAQQSPRKALLAAARAELLLFVDQHGSASAAARALGKAPSALLDLARTLGVEIQLGRPGRPPTPKESP